MRELYRAQGFPESYAIDKGAAGEPITKTAQVRMCGNSVCPPLARAIVAANYAEQHAAQRWAVVAGTGTQQLYLGREVECENMARKFAGAFLDGAFVAMQRTAPQPAPAPLSESIDQVERALAIIGVIGAIDGHDVVRRESVLEIARRAALAAQGGRDAG